MLVSKTNMMHRSPFFLSKWCQTSRFEGRTPQGRWAQNTDVSDPELNWFNPLLCMIDFSATTSWHRSFASGTKVIYIRI